MSTGGEQNDKEKQKNKEDHEKDEQQKKKKSKMKPNKQIKEKRSMYQRETSSILFSVEIVKPGLDSGNAV